MQGSYLERRGEGVSVEEGETSLDPPLMHTSPLGYDMYVS